jgi:hypothetical protein
MVNQDDVGLKQWHPRSDVDSYEFCVTFVAL